MKQVFVCLPSGKVLTCTVDTVDNLKDCILKKSGIPSSEQHLLYQNRPLIKDFDLPNGSTVHLLFKLQGGSKECDICSFPGEFICNECNEQITCKECCINIRVKHNTNHKKLIKPSPQAQQLPVLVVVKQIAYIIEVTQSIGMMTSLFTDSPSLNDTFESATKIATLAECY